METATLDAYLVGSSDQRPVAPSAFEGFRRHLRTRTLPTSRAALSLALRRNTPHHVLYADTDLRFLGPVARTLRTPVVGTFHEPTWGLDYMSVSDHVANRLTAAILVSETQRDYFRPWFPSDRTFVVPYGVDTEYFAPAGSLSADPRVIVAGSRYRNFGMMARAADIVADRNPDAVFTALGTNHQFGRPANDPGFRAIDRPDDATRLTEYQRAQVAVFPFAHAAASSELLQAMASGLPIVATDVGGVREYVGHAGLLCPPGDAKSLADAIVRVLDDRDLATELGARARIRSLHFDLDSTAARHRAVYQWCGR